MKQGTIKTIGAAVLGAAIAVSTAGTASAAAPAGPLERVTNLAAGTSHSLPIEEAAPLLPGGPLISAANRALGSTAMKATTAAVDKALFPTPAPKSPATKAAATAQATPADNKGNGGLLGLVPAGALPKGLSTPNLAGR
ncbi:hypothetical protein [Streptomyces sp. I05A-00742]|uniref:hypothetical protein n=1 Tax=Streptomyces sp. I05A-00742 TaxID=2732853 RepID=UPI0014899F6B|nr:hypothetical protein [Streptomyces sp. I05A-00742]